MFDCDLQFPHAYELLEPRELPGSGESELPLHYFPPPTRRSESDGLWIEVHPQAAQQWLCAFAYGYGFPPGFSRVLSTPDLRRVCVISSGQAYIVNTCDPKDWSIIPILPITDARSLPQCQFLLFADLSGVTAWGNDGIVWQVQFCLDGVKLSTVTSDLIEGYGYDPASDRDAQFIIETRTGKVLCG